MSRSRQEILLQLKSAKPGLEREFPLRRLALFGSWAREEASANSDVDVLVEFLPGATKSLLKLVEMEHTLTRLFGRSVDLNTPGNLSKYFRDQVIREAKVQYVQA